MKKLKEILTNPTAIAVAIMHWILVTFSLLFENTQFLSKSYTFDLPEPVIFNWLFFLNKPALIVIEFIVYPALYIFSKNLITEITGVVISVFCITFQWLFIGYCISSMIEFLKPKEVKSFLK